MLLVRWKNSDILYEKEKEETVSKKNSISKGAACLLRILTESEGGYLSPSKLSEVAGKNRFPKKKSVGELIRNGFARENSPGIRITDKGREFHNPNCYTPLMKFVGGAEKAIVITDVHREIKEKWFKGLSVKDQKSHLRRVQGLRGQGFFNYLSRNIPGFPGQGREK